jgi:transposase
MSRYDLTDFEWRVIEPLLPNKPRGVPRVDDRRVLNGIFWVLRSGAPWRDPARALWPEDHVLQPLRALATGGRVGPADGRDHSGLRPRHPDDRQHIDPGAPAGCDGKKGGRDHCLGRSRGGLTTKIHALVDRRSLPLRLVLTAGQAHDAPAALGLLDRLEPRTIVLADKAYDGNAIRDLIEAQGAVPNIPAKSNRKWKPCFSKTLYHERNQVERFFSKLKHFRRIATRYEKVADNFLAMVQLASMRLWLRAYESTA